MASSMDQTAEIFEKNYRHYRRQIADVDLASIAPILGLKKAATPP